MKKWQVTVTVAMILAFFGWVGKCGVDYYMSKATQIEINKNSKDDRSNIKEDIQLSRKIILHNLEKINKNVLNLRDSINKTNSRLEKVDAKVDGMDKKIRFIFNNTKDLKKYKDIFTETLQP